MSPLLAVPHINESQQIKSKADTLKLSRGKPHYTLAESPPACKCLGKRPSKPKKGEGYSKGIS